MHINSPSNAFRLVFAIRELANNTDNIGTYIHICTRNARRTPWKFQFSYAPGIYELHLSAEKYDETTVIFT